MKDDQYTKKHMSDSPNQPADAVVDIRSISETEFQKYFEQVYVEHIDILVKFAFFRLSDKEKAIDVVQDVFVNYFGHLKKVREKTDDHTQGINHKAFLFRSVRNAVIDHYRSKKSYSLDSLLEEGFDVDMDEDGGYTETEQKLNQKHLISKIKELKPKQQELIYMRYIEDMSVSDIAQALDERENTISVQIHRIIETLKKKI